MTTRWWEIMINNHPDLEETLFWRLDEFGCQGTSIVQEKEEWIIKAYIPAITTETIDLAAFSLLLRQDFILAGLDFPQISWQLIDDQDWGSNWKKHWQPMEIGENLTVYPAWIEPPAETDDIIIKIDPGFAFGTGVHPTTQLCLESLEMRLKDNEQEINIADIGCGSGILSIAARLLGAKQVIACDTDPLAVQATQENAHLNKLDNIGVFEGSIEQLMEISTLKFDGVVCNILADIIKPMIPEFSKILTPEGWLILSGILLEQSIEISELLEKNGWLIAALWREEGWCCINARPNPLN